MSFNGVTLRRIFPIVLGSALVLGCNKSDSGCVPPSVVAVHPQRFEPVAEAATGSAYASFIRFANAAINDLTPTVAYAASLQGSLTNVSLSSRPYALAINDDGVIYAPRLDAASAARFQLPSTEPTGHVSVGSIPTDVSFDLTGCRAFVSNQGGSVSVIDVSSNTVAQTITVPDRAFVSLVSPDNQRLYIGSAIGKVYVYDFGSSRLIDSITVGDVPQHLTFHPDGVRLYVSMRDLGRVVEVDTRANSVVRAFSSTYGVQEAVVGPEGGELYVANQSGWLEIWNLGTGGHIDDVPLGDGPWALTLSPDKTRLYAGILFDGTVAVINRSSRAVERYIDVGGIPRRIKFAPDNRTMVVANESGYITFIP
jgi:YVTN family beta-propeller protein